MKLLSSLSIRKKLLCLIFVAVLPALGIILFSGIKQREQDIVSTKRDIMHLVQSLAAQQEQIAAGTRQMLQTLAQLPEVQGIDGKACNRIFRDIQEQNPIYAILSAETPDGNMFAASAPFTPGSVNLADRKHIRDVIRTRDFSVGEYVVGRVSRVPSLQFTYPVLDKNRKLLAIMNAGLKLDKYKEFLTQINLPKGSVMSISDHKNITLYRLPERADIPPGTPLPLKNIQGIPVDSKEGFYEAIGRDNVSRIFAYKRLWLRDNEPPYLAIFVGVDKNVALHQANTELIYNLVFLGIACLFAMLVAWIAGNSIVVDPLSKLIIATQRFGEGQMHVRTDLPHREDELGRLAKSFDTMAVMLEMKDLERRKAEEELRENLTLYRGLIETTDTGFVILDQEGKTLEANQEYVRLSGHEDLSQIRGRSVTEWTADYEKEKNAEAVNRCFREGQIRNLEIDYVNTQGKITPIEINATVVKVDGVPQILTLCRDITDRKQAEEALQKSEEKYRSIFENAVEGIYQSTLEGQFITVNPAMARMHGYESPKEMIMSITNIGKQLYVNPEDRKRYKNLLEEHGIVEDLESQFYRKDGAIIWLSLSARVVRNDEGTVIHYEGIVEDTTTRKLAEDQIKALLSEKELLLSEVHHRIKNNMTVIMGMLSLQAYTLKDPSAIAALEDAGSRILSMMVLYDKLYRSADFREISAKAYLTSLIDEIVGNFPNHEPVTVEKQIDDLILDAKTLFPIGIILNELLTNAMKHAFPVQGSRGQGAKGSSEPLEPSNPRTLEPNEITIILKEHPAPGDDSTLSALRLSSRSGGSTLITLMIQDNGIGIPASIDIATSTGFGMRLVSILTGQLEGTIRIERQKGTMFVLEFEV